MRGRKNALILVISLLLLIDCTEKRSDPDVSSSTEKFSDIYYSTSDKSFYRAIEIRETAREIITIIHYPDLVESYTSNDYKNEIRVILANGNELHFFKNGEYELRMYKVVHLGEQPEDIEWTFYKRKKK